MVASFEDFLDLAEDRMGRAALAVTDGAKVSSATCAALSAVTRSLIAISTRYGLMPNGIPAAAWQPEFVTHLSAADRQFRYHAQTPVAPTAADELISDAARLLTMAQDLLATHLTTPDPPRPFARTPQGEELLDAPVRDHLLRRAADLARHLALLTRAALHFDDQPHPADVYRPRQRDLIAAVRDLTEAANEAPESPTARLDLTPAPALAAPIIYPVSGEGPAEAARHIHDATGRLATAAYRSAHSLHTGEHPPTHTASDLREIAASLALAHILAADLLTRLTPRLLPATGWNSAEGVDRLRAAGAAWARLRRPWRQLVSAPDSGPRSPLTVQAVSIPIRLGRLLYADPGWTPQAGPGQPRVLEDLCAPDVLDAICMSIGALPRDAVTIAASHARLVADAVLDLYSTDRAHRPESEGRRFYPLQSAQRAELTTGYRNAANASRAAATDLAPLARGYEAMKATALTRLSQSIAKPSLDDVRQLTHLRLQQPTADRPISRKL